MKASDTDINTEILSALKATVSTLKNIEKDTNYALHDEFMCICSCSLCRAEELLAKMESSP